MLGSWSMKPDFLVPRSLLPSEKVIFLGLPYNNGEQRDKSPSLGSKHTRCVQQRCVHLCREICKPKVRNRKASTGLAVFPSSPGEGCWSRLFCCTWSTDMPLVERALPSLLVGSIGDQSCQLYRKELLVNLGAKKSELWYQLLMRAVWESTWAPWVPMRSQVWHSLSW